MSGAKRSRPNCINAEYLADGHRRLRVAFPSQGNRREVSRFYFEERFQMMRALAFGPNDDSRYSFSPHSIGDFVPGAGGTYLPMILNSCPTKPGFDLAWAKPFAPAGAI